MVVSYFRPLLLVVAGAAIGSLIVFGLMRAGSQTGTAGTQTAVTANDAQPHFTQAVVKDTETPAVPETPSLVTAQTSASPSPNASPGGPSNLPLGVRPDAVNMEVYKKLPGVQPPLINRDGRDMGAEAIQMLETVRPSMPFPGIDPNASVTPVPFPQTVEEIKKLGPQEVPSASPSPAAQ